MDETLDQTQPVGGLQATADKTGKLSVAGKIALDPTQTGEILANMQAMIDQRQTPMSMFNRGLERAAAWGSGGIQGPSAALNQLNTREQADEQNVFNMRQQMAAYKAAQAQQERFNQRKNAELGGGFGAAPGTPGAMTEDTMPQQIRNALANAADDTEYKKIYNTWAQKQAEIYANPNMDEPKIPVVDMVNGKPVLKTISTREYRANPGRYQDTPQTQAAVNTVSAPAPSTGITPEAIRKVESNNNAAAVSPKGAEGTMQVMPATQTAPGFGVTPAANKTPQELERVGGDYFKAMQNKYKDDVTAAIAYNMGPGATDKWIANGKKFEQLPAETQGYINKLTNQPAAAVPEIPKIRAEVMAARPTPGEMTRQQEVETAATKEFATNTAKANAVKAQKIDDAGSSAPEREARFNDVIAITEDPEMKEVFGLLAKKGFTPFVLKQLEEGVNAGQFGTMGVANLQRNLMMAGATPSQIEKMLRVEKHLAKAELEYAQMYLTGQGAVSDNERKLVKDAVFNTKDPASVMRMQAKVMAERAEFDRKIKDAYDNYREQRGDNASFPSFMRNEAKGIVNEHNQKLATIIGKSPSMLNDPISAKAMSADNYKPGSIKWGNPSK